MNLEVKASDPRKYGWNGIFFPFPFPFLWQNRNAFRFPFRELKVEWNPECSFPEWDFHSGNGIFIPIPYPGLSVINKWLLLMDFLDSFYNREEIESKRKRGTLSSGGAPTAVGKAVALSHRRIAEPRWQ